MGLSKIWYPRIPKDHIVFPIFKHGLSYWGSIPISRGTEIHGYWHILVVNISHQ